MGCSPLSGEITLNFGVGGGWRLGLSADGRPRVLSNFASSGEVNGGPCFWTAGLFGQSGEAILAPAGATICASALMSADSSGCGPAAGVYEERARLTAEAGGEAPGFTKPSRQLSQQPRRATSLAGVTFHHGIRLLMECEVIWWRWPEKPRSPAFFLFFFSLLGASKGHGSAAPVSHVLPSRSPALASKNKCLINGFSDHPKRLPRARSKVVSEQNNYTAHTRGRLVGPPWPPRPSQWLPAVSLGLLGNIF